MFEVESPGGRCPMCGNGKLIVEYLNTWDDRDNPGAFAKFYCVNDRCSARFNANAGFYAIGLAQLMHDAYVAERERFRESIGGFQFTDCNAVT